MFRRPRPLFAAFLVTAVASLACGTSTVQGERGLSGECPRGEVCSELTPEGLLFTGMAFWDEPGLVRLGPVLAGGKFEVSFTTPDLEPLRAYEVFGSGAVDAYADGEGAIAVGREPGSGFLRVEDGRGTLYDRLPLEVVEVEDVEIANVLDPGRTTLYAGCSEMVGLRLIATSGGARFRAFDAEVVLDGPGGGVVPDALLWDCFHYAVPTGVDAVTFTVTTGEVVLEYTVDVVEVDPSQCPEVQPD